MLSNGIKGACSLELSILGFKSCVLRSQEKHAVLRTTLCTSLRCNAHGPFWESFAYEVQTVFEALRNMARVRSQVHPPLDKTTEVHMPLIACPNPSSYWYHVPRRPCRAWRMRCFRGSCSQLTARACQCISHISNVSPFGKPAHNLGVQLWCLCETGQ